MPPHEPTDCRDDFDPILRALRQLRDGCPYRARATVSALQDEIEALEDRRRSAGALSAHCKMALRRRIAEISAGACAGAST